MRAVKPRLRKRLPGAAGMPDGKDMGQGQSKRYGQAQSRVQVKGRSGDDYYEEELGLRAGFSVSRQKSLLIQSLRAATPSSATLSQAPWPLPSDCQT